MLTISFTLNSCTSAVVHRPWDAVESSVAPAGGRKSASGAQSRTLLGIRAEPKPNVKFRSLTTCLMAFCYRVALWYALTSPAMVH